MCIVGSSVSRFPSPGNGSQHPVFEIGFGLVPRVVQTGDGEWLDNDNTTVSCIGDPNLKTEDQRALMTAGNLATLKAFTEQLIAKAAQAQQQKAQKMAVQQSKPGLPFQLVALLLTMLLLLSGLRTG